MIEGYTPEEVMEFCQGYMKGVESIDVPKSRYSGRLDGKGGVGDKIIMPSFDDLQLENLVVVRHMTCLAPYIDKHMDILMSNHPGKDQMWYIKIQNQELAMWL
ncbi:hypothetical protein L1887_23446 [Cichorium endivia]|nr:hypothetical protein L1887_23446 [Cichorium endivia]